MVFVLLILELILVTGPWIASTASDQLAPRRAEEVSARLRGGAVEAPRWRGILPQDGATAGLGSISSHVSEARRAFAEALTPALLPLLTFGVLWRAVARRTRS